MRLTTALRLGRVSNLPTVASNVLAGGALAGSSSASALAVTWVACSSLYVGGMFLNDACDAEIDTVERPERPIPSGLASRREVLGWAAGLLLVGVALALTVTAAAGVGAAVTAGLIVLYDVVHKRTAFAPAIMGACRMGVYWTAACTAAEPQWPAVALGSLVLFGYVLGLTYAAARENSTGLVRVGPLLGLFAPAFVIGPRLALSILDLFCLVAFLAWVGFCTRRVRTRMPALIRSGIGGLIAGIALLDALWLASTASGALLVVLALSAFGATLALQRRVAGT